MLSQTPAQRWSIRFSFVTPLFCPITVVCLHFCTFRTPLLRSCSNDRCKFSMVIEAVKKWFLDNETLVLTAYGFADQHCQIIDAEEETLKLEYTEFHRQFQELFEAKLNEYLES